MLVPKNVDILDKHKKPTGSEMIRGVDPVPEARK